MYYYHYYINGWMDGWIQINLYTFSKDMQNFKHIPPALVYSFRDKLGGSFISSIHADIFNGH